MTGVEESWEMIGWQFGDSGNNTEKNTIDQEELLFMVALTCSMVPSQDVDRVISQLLQDLFESISTDKISAAYSHFSRSKILRIYVQDMQEVRSCSFLPQLVRIGGQDAVGEDLLLLTNKWLR